MLVIGFNGGTNLAHEDIFDLDLGQSHDSAAVLVDDGRVVAAIEQERLDRIKHSNKLPIDAIRFCLNDYGVGVNDIDAFVYYTSKPVMDVRLKENCLARLFVKDRTGLSPSFTRSEDFFSYMLTEGLGAPVPAERIQFVKHHVAHLISAYAFSGFERALLLSIDGVGEGESGRVAVAERGALKTIQVFGHDVSLGRFYNWAIRYIGFLMFDAYKAMGLAPYGDPARYRAIFRRFYKLLPKGQYRTFPGQLPELFNVITPRQKGEPFTQEHKDLAAALQEMLEEVVMHVLRHYRQATGQPNLCLAGGVAHNCTMNGKIAASGLFDHVFVQPASHDAGCALGAALSSYYPHVDGTTDAAKAQSTTASRSRITRLANRAWNKLGKIGSQILTPAPQAITLPDVPLPPSHGVLDHVYWGTDIAAGPSVPSVLELWRTFVMFEKCEGIERRAATLLADKKVIGWVQGRSEFGPRALGNRSILADARPAEHKEIINAMVKKREGFRPFAPAVLEEDAAEYFELAGLQDCPFMVFIVKVQPDKRQLLGAITHVDGSARVQTVSRKANPRYWNLIHEFKTITGVPVVLNTSFNNNAEPIVDSVEDAIVCFLTTNLHYLVVDDFLISKNEVTPAAFGALVPNVPRHLQLKTVKRFNANGALTEYVITSNCDSLYQRSMSHDVFRLLLDADGHKTLDELVDANAKPSRDVRENWYREIVDLWAARAVILRPRSAAHATS